MQQDTAAGSTGSTPRNARAAAAAATAELAALIGSEQVRTDDASRFAASFDNARFSFLPDAVVVPRNEADIAATLRLANARDIPVTVRGAGSGCAGAAAPLNGGWVLSLAHWTNIEIDAAASLARVQPGALTGDVDAAAAACGLFYPPDPSSVKYCTIGGNIATNAGGLRAAKYGVCRDYVLALEGFLPTGEFARWGGAVRKYVSGLNMKDLIIGSEGLLFVITRAVLRLVPRPKFRHTFLLAFDDDEAALAAATALLAAHITPSVLEFMDALTVGCAERRNGRKVFGELSPSRCKRVPAPPIIPFESGITQFLAGKLSTNCVLDLGEVPAAFKQVGASGHLLVFQSVLNKAMGSKHHIPSEVVAGIKAQLSAPQAIFTSDNEDAPSSHRVALLDAQMPDGRVLVAVVDIAGKHGTNVVTDIRSIHPKEHKFRILHWVEQGRTLWRDAGKMDVFLDGIGAELSPADKENAKALLDSVAPANSVDVQQCLHCAIAGGEGVAAAGTVNFEKNLDRVRLGSIAVERGRTVSADKPPAVLLVEVDGMSAGAVGEDAAAVRAWAAKNARAFRETADTAEAEALWNVRRTCSQAMFQLGDAKLNEDVVVPLAGYAPLIRYAREIHARTGLATPTFGHAADGN
ncbi:MAG: FAD-binding protein, partial [Puniceicoccales bacterium]|nr:FAD-binding protein [Puniceicoccales bacterium]